MDLHKFFEEKEIPFTQWEIEHNGEINFIDTEVVIEAIIASKDHERAKISGTLFILDFKNASILDYLHYLAKCMIQERYHQINGVN